MPGSTHVSDPSTSTETLVQAIEDRLDAWGVPERVDLEDDAALTWAAVGGIEEVWDVVVPQRLLDEVRERSALARVIAERVRHQTRLRARREPLVFRAAVRIHLTPPQGGPTRETCTSGRIGPYDVDAIVDQAVRAGNGARLELSGADQDGRALRALKARVEARTRGGVEVTVRTVDASGGVPGRS